MVNDMPCGNMTYKHMARERSVRMCFVLFTATKHQSADNEDDQLHPTLSGEQDLLGIARQPEPRWSLSVWKHFYPVHELLTSVTNHN